MLYTVRQTHISKRVEPICCQTQSYVSYITGKLRVPFIKFLPWLAIDRMPHNIIIIWLSRTMLPHKFGSLRSRKQPFQSRTHRKGAQHLMWYIFPRPFTWLQFPPTLWQTGQVSFNKFSFQNSAQSFLHTWIELYPKPIFVINLFAS